MIMEDIAQIYTFQDKYLAKQCSNECYKSFYDNLKKSFTKFPNDKVKFILEPIISNDLVLIGTPENNKNFVLGQTIIGNNKIAGVVINSIVHDINFDGDSLNFNKIIGSIYYILINTILSYLIQDVYKDESLKEYSYKYFNYLLVKCLSLSNLIDLKKMNFDYICSYFFYTYYFNMNPNLSYEKASENIFEKDKLLIKKEEIIKYKKITDMYNVLSFYNILQLTPNNIKMNLINSIGTFAYLSIHSNIENLIPSLILSKYSHPNFKQLFISTDLINNIENIILDNYLSKIIIDINIMKDFFKMKTSEFIKTSI